MRSSPPADPRQAPSRLSRRSLFAGASAVGAAAAVVAVAPRMSVPSQAEPAPQAPRPERGGGYSLSEHVKHYYKTTRL